MPWTVEISPRQIPKDNAAVPRPKLRNCQTLKPRKSVGGYHSLVVDWPHGNRHFLGLTHSPTGLGAAETISIQRTILVRTQIIRPIITINGRKQVCSASNEQPSTTGRQHSPHGYLKNCSDDAELCRQYTDMPLIFAHCSHRRSCTAIYSQRPGNTRSFGSRHICGTLGSQTGLLPTHKQLWPLGQRTTCTPFLRSFHPSAPWDLSFLRERWSREWRSDLPHSELPHPAGTIANQRCCDLRVLTPLKHIQEGGIRLVVRSSSRGSRDETEPVLRPGPRQGSRFIKPIVLSASLYGRRSEA